MKKKLPNDFFQEPLWSYIKTGIEYVKVSLH